MNESAISAFGGKPFSRASFAPGNVRDRVLLLPERGAREVVPEGVVVVRRRPDDQRGHVAKAAEHGDAEDRDQRVARRVAARRRAPGRNDGGAGRPRSTQTAAADQRHDGRAPPTARSRSGRARATAGARSRRRARTRRGRSASSEVGRAAEPQARREQARGHQEQRGPEDERSEGHSLAILYDGSPAR